MGEFKKSMWKLERAEKHFRQQRVKYKNACFKMMIPGRIEERNLQAESLKKGGFARRLTSDKRKSPTEKIVNL